MIRVAKHVVQRDFGRANEFVISDLTVDDGATTLVQTTNDSAYACKKPVV
jgi:hypothetical protein